MPTPLSNRPKISANDISRGFVMRYFTKLIADRIRVYEIDEKQYNTFKKDKQFITIQLPWIIAGNDVDYPGTDGSVIVGAKTRNEKIIEYYSKQIPTLPKVLKNPLEYFFGTTNRVPSWLVPVNGRYVDIRIVNGANINTTPLTNPPPSVTPVEPEPEPQYIGNDGNWSGWGGTPVFTTIATVTITE